MAHASSIEPLLERARWEAAHARPYFAYRLYLEAWSTLTNKARRTTATRTPCSTSSTTARWSREDEERFQKELDEFAKDVEPPAKKHLRVIWKLFGAHALKGAIHELPVLLGAGPLPAIGVLVAEYAARYVEKKVDDALEEP